MAIDHCIDKIGLGEPRVQFLGAFWSAVPFDGERTAWLKPHTYMNLSGKSVAEAARYFDIEPHDILVVYDDVAQPFGRVRYRDGGSAGGHNGMKSIIGALGTLDIPRLRIGVGEPDKQVDMKDWVLGRFTKAQRDAWHSIESIVWDAVVKWARGDAGEGFTMKVPEPNRSE